MATQDLPSKGMKAVLIRHAEKIVFGIVCLVCLALVTLSWMREKPKIRTPEQLSQQVTSAHNNIKAPTWEQAGRAEDLSGNLETINNSEDDQIDYAWYSYDMPWHMPPFPPSAKREDPDLYPVEQLTVTGVGIGAVAWSDGETDVAGGGGRGNRPAPPARRLGDDQEEEERPRELDPSIELPGYPGRPGLIAKSAHYVAITGVVPNARQYQAYEDAFGLADDYQPTRDRPNWISYIVQRADVTQDPYGEVPEDAWERIAYMRKVNDEAGLGDTEGLHWAERLQEVVDPEQILENTLTGPIPPIMLQDVTEAAAHPLIPLRDPNSIEEEEEEEQADAEEEEGADEDDSIIGGGIVGQGRETRERETSARDGRAERDPGDVNYKLFRFFDLTAEPGHTYRYRVQLYLEDPNNPQDSAAAPPESALQDPVAQRVRQNNAGRQRIFYRISPMSEPTDPVTIPFGRQVVAGKVGEPSFARVRGGGNYPSPVTEQQQSGELLVIQWDEEVDVDDRTVPMNMMAVKDVVRGEVLFFEETVEVLDPTLGNFVKVEDYPFEIEKVVLDMTGGEELPGIRLDRSDKPVTGGQILLLDENGNLEVHDSLLEENTFRELQYLPEEPEDTLDSSGGLNGGAPSGLPGVPAVPPGRPPRSGLDGD